VQHPQDEELIEALFAGLDDPGSRAVREHLERGCPSCAERAAELQELVLHLRTDRDADPPEAWVRRAVALMAERRSTDLRELLGRFWGEVTPVVARVVRDTFAGPSLAPAGLRGESPRRLGFESDDLELDLSIEPAPDRTHVTAQLVTLDAEPAPAEGARVLVTGAPAFSAERTTDAGGEFSFEARCAFPLRVHVAYRDRFVLFEVPAPPNR
jgi:hypothetical protein